VGPEGNVNGCLIAIVNVHIIVAVEFLIIIMKKWYRRHQFVSYGQVSRVSETHVVWLMN